MTDEEVNEDQPDIIIGDPAGEPVEKTPPQTIPEEKPCDPTTMSCEQMRDKILGLSTERAKYDNTLERLKEIKTAIPSSELDKIFDDTMKKKEAIDSEIYGTFEKFTICTTPKPKEEKHLE